MHLSIASPPPPSPGDHGGFDRFDLPEGGEFDHKVGYRGGAHWLTPVCTVVSACTGWGYLTISSVPGWGFRIHLTPPPWSNPHHLLGGGGGVPWGMQLIGELVRETAWMKMLLSGVFERIEHWDAGNLFVSCTEQCSLLSKLSTFYSISSLQEWLEMSKGLLISTGQISRLFHYQFYLKDSPTECLPPWRRFPKRSRRLILPFEKFDISGHYRYLWDSKRPWLPVSRLDLQTKIQL